MQYRGTVSNLECVGESIVAYVYKGIRTDYLDYDRDTNTPEEILADLERRGIEVTETGRDILYGHFLE